VARLLPDFDGSRRRTVVYCRVSFDFLEHVATRHGCEIAVANQEALSLRQELVEDLLAIVHTFSCRLYGLCRFEKTSEAELTGGGR
jgi:putative resolvase